MKKGGVIAFWVIGVLLIIALIGFFIIGEASKHPYVIFFVGVGIIISIAVALDNIHELEKD